MASTPYSLRLSDEQKARIEETATQLALTPPDVMRMAINFGLPILRRRLQIRAARTADAKPQSPGA